MKASAPFTPDSLVKLWQKVQAFCEFAREAAAQAIL